jgi:GNAT superfamily N-acetyltransferase
MADWAVERLAAHHDRAGFACGKAALDDFLIRFASQYEKRDLARVYVAVEPPAVRILGHYSLSAGAVSLDALPESGRKKLPRHPVPVAHLGRLAVDLSARGRRLGEFLLLDALRRTARSADDLGLHAVEVYAIDEDARRFYLKYGFTPLIDDPLHLYVAMKTVRAMDEAEQG